MYTFGTNYPDIDHYKDSDHFRNIKGDLLWEDQLCSHVQEDPDGIIFKWDSSEKYLPIEFTYSFIQEVMNSFIYNKDLRIKDGITKVSFMVPMHINNFLDIFKFN